MNNAPSQKTIHAIRRALLAWYRREARDLPWRRTDDPYKIWTSEIMLQQTRVEAVIDYYNRFLKAFPTVKALAKAPIDRVLKQWEGLGYYSRARNLHKTAKLIVERGAFPETVTEWMALPGIGRYSAGAVCSIAFGVCAPVVDGNVKRVLSRLFAIEDSIDDAKTVAQMWGLAEQLVSPSKPGDFNQSLMELGARVCLPRQPKCDECPLVKRCSARLLNIERTLPVRNDKKTPPHAHVVAAAIKKNGRYLLGRRPESGMLGGLWEFPGGKVEPGETHHEALRREIREELGGEVNVGAHVATVDHAYSHLTVTIHLYQCEWLSDKPKTLYHDALKWVSRKQFNQYAFPKANLKFLDLL